MMTTLHIMHTDLGDVAFERPRRKDIYAISELTRGKNLIYRSPEEVEILLPCYHVAVRAETGEIVGCISAKMYGTDAEIVSYRLNKQFRGQGVGRQLIKMQLQFLVGRAGIERIFALTTKEVAVKIFLKAGFIEVGIQLFGPKVLLECSRCPKNIISEGRHLCDEIAVIYRPS